MERELKRVTVNLQMGENTPTIPVVAHTTAVAGLVVHAARTFRKDKAGHLRVVVRRNRWNITLFPCGYKVFGDIPTFAQAKFICEMKLAQYNFVGLTIDDIRNSNDMTKMSSDAIEIRQMIAEMRGNV